MLAVHFAVWLGGRHTPEKFNLAFWAGSSPVTVTIHTKNTSLVILFGESFRISIGFGSAKLLRSKVHFFSEMICVTHFKSGLILFIFNRKTFLSMKFVFLNISLFCFEKYYKGKVSNFLRNCGAASVWELLENKNDKWGGTNAGNIRLYSLALVNQRLQLHCELCWWYQFSSVKRDSLNH